MTAVSSACLAPIVRDAETGSPLIGCAMLLPFRHGLCWASAQLKRRAGYTCPMDKGTAPCLPKSDNRFPLIWTLALDMFERLAAS